MRLLSRARAFAKREDGATAIEYGLIAALIAVIVIAAISAVGPDVDTPLPVGGTGAATAPATDAR